MTLQLRLNLSNALGSAVEKTISLLDLETKVRFCAKFLLNVGRVAQRGIFLTYCQNVINLLPPPTQKESR